jgi:F0F1-type ATP synthase delta subunit
MHTIARRKLAQHAASELLAGTNAQQLGQQLAAYLADAGKTADAGLLIRDIESALTARGVSVLHITSARALDDESRRELIAAVKQAEQTKQAVIVSETIDPELIGGAAVRTSERSLDVSIRGSLQQLKRLSKNRLDTGY